nr:hypothetical protein [Mastigocladopsis repens]
MNKQLHVQVLFQVCNLVADSRLRYFHLLCDTPTFHASNAILYKLGVGKIKFTPYLAPLHPAITQK